MSSPLSWITNTSMAQDSDSVHARYMRFGTVTLSADWTERPRTKADAITLYQRGYRPSETEDRYLLSKEQRAVAQEEAIARLARTAREKGIQARRFVPSDDFVFHSPSRPNAVSRDWRLWS